jgi:hypothetical protein
MKIHTRLLFVAAFLANNVRALATPKKILLCFDGTGNSPNQFGEAVDKGDALGNPTTQTITNVLKMHLLAGGSIDNQKGQHIDGQHSIYSKGVGTYGGKVFGSLNQIMGGINIQFRDMESKLSLVYEEGDTLYITGFSRGSACARKFACEISEKGIKVKGRKGRIMNPRIELLGVFDTVSDQVGKNLLFLNAKLVHHLPSSRPLGENGKVAANINRAVHLVSMDDDRSEVFSPLPFPPTLMGKEDRVHQVWFPGQHGDLGGWQVHTDLSDGALLYMKKQFEEAGITFLDSGEVRPEAFVLPKKMFDWGTTAKPVLTNDDLKIKPNPCGIANNANGQESYRVVCAVEDDTAIDNGEVLVHESVFQRKMGTLPDGITYKPNPLLKQPYTIVS